MDAHNQSEARRAWRAPASGGRQNHTYVLMLVVQRTATMPDLDWVPLRLEGDQAEIRR
jgi:hypothetical protein